MAFLRFGKPKKEATASAGEPQDGTGTNINTYPSTSPSGSSKDVAEDSEAAGSQPANPTTADAAGHAPVAVTENTDEKPSATVQAEETKEKPAAVDDAQDDARYPSGTKLALLTFGLSMATFVIALDGES